jgi:hypothetical protein
MASAMNREWTAGSISRIATRAGRGAAGVALLALLALLAAAPSARAATVKQPDESGWVSISYRDLLDPEVLTHSGVKLGDALRQKGSQREIQAFFDPYTALLGYAVQMLSGPDALPQTSLAERYPAGSAQPAWAALLREGKYFVSTDGQGHARVFVPGADPRDAYRRAYSVVRHPLAAALKAGAALQVEVFAYRNDYAAAELHLNPLPLRLRATAFPPRGQPLDLEALQAFFRQGGQLEGAELAPGEGLVLYASRAQQQRLGAEAVALADLAVAYRAVFHAGAVEAFVSLDKNADPTLATVNFGGLLEDTRLGKAVLAADLRFKTVCSGLDPVSFADIRETTRRAVPSFMSNSERNFLAGAPAEISQWLTARYWYYPDSCGVEADEEDQLAAITKTQLTADVERVDVGAGAASKGRPALPAAFRENITDLNRNYAGYAALFPEFRDLSSAARLMALAAWFGRVRPAWLDLDGLLAVTLPPESTPRTRPQLLSAEILQFPAAGTPDRDYVLRNTQVRHLTPELEKSVAEYFGEPRHLAAFLAFKAGKDPSHIDEFTAEADRLFPTLREKPVRDLVRTTGDLHAFLRSFAARLIGERSSARPAVTAADRARLEALLAELAALPSGAAEAGIEEQRARLDQQIREVIDRYHEQGSPPPPTVVITQYIGGVSLSPRLFSVKKSKSGSSPALERLRVASRAAGAATDGSGWIRSGAARRSARPAAAQAPRPAGGITRPQPPGPDSAVEESAPPRPAAVKPAMSSIAVPGSAATGGAPLLGRLGENRRIVFTRAPR